MPAHPSTLGLPRRPPPSVTSPSPSRVRAAPFFRPLQVPTQVSWTQRDDGQWVVHDPGRRLTWVLGDATVQLLEATRAGWTPDQDLPAGLQAMVGAPRLTSEQWAEIVDGLEAVDLLPATPDPTTTSGQPVIRPMGDATGATSQVRTLSWSDLRLGLGAVPPPPPGLRAGVLRLAPIVGLASLGAGVLAVVWGRQGLNSPLVAAWAAATAGWHPTARLALQALSVVLLVLIHELGHAVALGAATGRAVPVGLRLFYGLPQGYTEATEVRLLPRRQDRLAVLFGGLAVELVVWVTLLGLVLLRLRAGGAFGSSVLGALVLACVLFTGPVTMAWNLLPFFRTDGYFVLEELSGVFNLRHHAEQSLRAFFGEPSVEGRPPWLPWYGAATVVLRLSLVLVIAIGLGRYADAPNVGAAVGLALAVFVVHRVHTRLRPATSPDLQRASPTTDASGRAGPEASA